MSKATEPQDSNRLAIFDPWLLSVTLIWGYNFVVYKMVMRVVPALSIIGVRFGLLSPLLLAVAWVLSPPSKLQRQSVLRLLWAGLVVMGGQQVTFIKALDATSATEGAVLITSAPIFTALIAVALGHERLSPLNWLGVFLGFAGTALVIGGTGGATGPQQSHLLGNLLMLVSAILYGYFMVLSKDLLRRHGALKTVAYCYCLAAVVVVPLAVPDLLRTPWTTLDAMTWFWLVGYIGLLAGVYGFTVWYTTIGRTTASRTAVYQYLVPVVAMVSAALFLGERIHALQLVGAAVVLAGLVLTRWQQKQ
ncbi:MAG: DMT family transporter [Armatimonadetes bacterium]|nr:DMT family transporter [Armatimonadota bacterium]